MLIRERFIDLDRSSLEREINRSELLHLIEQTTLAKSISVCAKDVNKSVGSIAAQCIHRGLRNGKVSRLACTGTFDDSFISLLNFNSLRSLRSLDMDLDHQYWYEQVSSTSRQQHSDTFTSLTDLEELKLSFWLPSYPKKLKLLRLTADVESCNECDYPTWPPILDLDDLEVLELDPPPWVHSEYDFPEQPIVRCTRLKTLLINDYFKHVDTARMTSTLLRACQNLKRFTWWNSSLCVEFPLPRSLVYLRTGGISEVDMHQFPVTEKIKPGPLLELIAKAPGLQYLELEQNKVALSKDRRLFVVYLVKKTNLLTITIADLQREQESHAQWKSLFQEFSNALSWRTGVGGLNIDCAAIREKV